MISHISISNSFWFLISFLILLQWKLLILRLDVILSNDFYFYYYSKIVILSVMMNFIEFYQWNYFYYYSKIVVYEIISNEYSWNCPTTTNHIYFIIEWFQSIPRLDELDYNSLNYSYFQIISWFLESFIFIHTLISLRFIIT